MNLNIFKRQLAKLAGASITRMGDIIIFTTVAGWMASSAAQIYGIAVNKNYSREQKKYMINQEVFDAITNIGLYFGITKSLTMLSSALVRTGKIAPKSVVNFINKSGFGADRGTPGFDVTELADFNKLKDVRNAYNGFKCFADASTATVGGIISTNIITPIVRNEIAAYRQNKFKKEQALKMKVSIPAEQIPVKNTVNTKPINTPSHSFSDYKRHVLSI